MCLTKFSELPEHLHFPISILNDFTLQASHYLRNICTKKKEVIITSCYITPYCLYAYKILVLSYHICKSASMHPPHHYLSEGCILYTAIYDSLYAQPHGLCYFLIYTSGFYWEYLIVPFYTKFQYMFKIQLYGNKHIP